MSDILEKIHPHNSDLELDHRGSPRATSDVPTSSVPLLTPPEISRVSQGSSFISLWQRGVLLFVPTISIVYLAFCYVVHYRVVPAKVSGLTADTTTQFLTNIGSAITTINIIIISLALLPLKSFLSELKSEEFFRLLSAPKNRRGVELSAINGISNSSYGFLESILVVINRHCSLYYVVAFIAGVFVWAVSTLAPAARE
ncbi:hypothetical protein EV363DRAFT_1092786, partial [Boletus edulis]